MPVFAGKNVMMLFELTRGKTVFPLTSFSKEFVLTTTQLEWRWCMKKDETLITECGQDLSEDRLVARERRIVFFINCRD